MAEVEKVVDDQLVVDVHLDPVPLRQHAGSSGIEVREVGDQVGIGFVGSHPDPQHGVSLDDRVRAHRERGRDATRAVGVQHARAIGAETKTVVRTLD